MQQLTAVNKDKYCCLLSSVFVFSCVPKVLNRDSTRLTLKLVYCWTLQLHTCKNKSKNSLCSKYSRERVKTPSIYLRGIQTHTHTRECTRKVHEHTHTLARACTHTRSCTNTPECGNHCPEHEIFISHKTLILSLSLSLVILGAGVFYFVR